MCSDGAEFIIQGVVKHISDVGTAYWYALLNLLPYMCPHHPQVDNHRSQHILDPVLAMEASLLCITLRPARRVGNHWRDYFRRPGCSPEI